MDKITRAQKKAFKKYIKVATPLEVIDLYWRIKRAKPCPIKTGLGSQSD